MMLVSKSLQAQDPAYCASMVQEILQNKEHRAESPAISAIHPRVLAALEQCAEAIHYVHSIDIDDDPNLEAAIENIGKAQSVLDLDAEDCPPWPYMLIVESAINRALEEVSGADFGNWTPEITCAINGLRQ